MIRDALSWFMRTVFVRGGWRLVPTLNRHFGGGRATIRLRQVGTLNLNLDAKEQSELFWSGLETQERLIVRWMDSHLESTSVVVDAGAKGIPGE